MAYLFVFVAVLLLYILLLVFFAILSVVKKYHAIDDYLDLTKFLATFKLERIFYI